MQNIHLILIDLFFILFLTGDTCDERSQRRVEFSGFLCEPDISGKQHIFNRVQALCIHRHIVTLYQHAEV